MDAQDFDQELEMIEQALDADLSLQLSFLVSFATS
jgi:hypothetical protein